MASVRHHLCRVDFDPENIVGHSTMKVTDLEGNTYEIQVRTTHLIAAVLKMVQVLTTRNLAISEMIQQADHAMAAGQEICTDEDCTFTHSHLRNVCGRLTSLDRSRINQMSHARVCSVKRPHSRDQCKAIDYAG